MLTKGERTAALVREKAAELFYDKGFSATTLREVASASGVKVGSLYNHISSKEDLLEQVMGGVMEDILKYQATALRGKDGAVERLLAAVDCHLRFHATEARKVFIGNNNIRFLSNEARAAITSKRSEYAHMIQGLIEDVCREGQADVLDARLHAYSIIALGNDVATWYRADGRLSLQEIVEVYSKVALRGLGVPNPDARVDASRLTTGATTG